MANSKFLNTTKILKYNFKILFDEYFCCFSYIGKHDPAHLLINQWKGLLEFIKMSNMCQIFLIQYSLRISLSDCSKRRNNKRIKQIYFYFFFIDIKIKRMKHYTSEIILKIIKEGIFQFRYIVTSIV